jgi:hypothetical protein
MLRKEMRVHSASVTSRVAFASVELSLSAGRVVYHAIVVSIASEEI